MITGVINTDNISQVLRSISQRRQQGVLEVNFSDRRIDIFFVQGKVVDVQHSDQNHLLEVLETLQRGKRVPEDFVLEAASYEELQLQLAGVGVDEELFKLVLKHRILDRLYRLDFDSSAYYNFKVQMVEGDRKVLPAVSVGQLLLDLVSLESEKAGFESAFPSQARLECGLSASFASEEERLLYESIGAGGTVAEVAARCMLSCFHYREALSALHERGFVTVTGGASAETGTERGFDVSSIVEALEQSARADLLASMSIDAPGEPPAAAGEELEPPGRLAELRMQVGFWSARLLQERAVPHVIVYLFLAAALLLPLFFWGGILARF